MNSTEKYRVLIVDDDKKLCALVREYLAGYDMECECVYDGQTGLARSLEGRFDAILLDMMLPKLDGLMLLKQLRKKNESVPVIIISAQTDASDRIVGLEMGADAYVPKTFSPRELLARLRVVIRRASPVERQKTKSLLTIRELTINSDSQEASLDGKNLELSATEFRILYILASNAGCILSREKLVASISERWYEKIDRSIDMHISSLRKKLGDSPHTSHWIRTVRGDGYMLIK